MTDWVAGQTARELQPAVCVVCGNVLITYRCDRDHWLSPLSRTQTSITTPSEECNSEGKGDLAHKDLGTRAHSRQAQ